MSLADDIKSRLDIVDVVSGHVALQKAGRNYKAPCPFHTDKTPSFVVSPERQSWRCFGACATGGDVISFVMRAERLDFADAARQLADKAGITIAERREGARGESSYRLNKLAASFYRDVLRSSEGQDGMAYLSERGLDTKVIEAFELGLSPKGGDKLKQYFQTHDVSLDQAVEAGLLRRGEDGSIRDFFWGRLMFPIHDRQGRVTGFGGRALDGSMPKYLNTASTPIFDKSKTLYGLHMSAESIRELGTAVVVEGYMDAIAAHQHGFSNVVASMGTSLTVHQVSRIKSLATTFVLALDPDAAGQEATLRSLESSWGVFQRQMVSSGQRSIGPLYQSEQPRLKIAALPTGVDPDKVIRRDSGEWERLVRDAIPYKDYTIHAVASKYDLSTPNGKAQAAEALAPLITGAADPIEQEHYFRKMAGVLGVSASALEASIGKSRPVGPRVGPRRSRAEGEHKATVSALAEQGEDFLEDYILAVLIKRPELKEKADGLAPEQFHKTEDREVFTHWLGCSTMDELWAGLDQALHDHLQTLLEIDLVPAGRAEAEEALAQCVRRLEERHLQELQEGMLLSVDPNVPPPADMEEAIVEVNSRLKELFTQRT